MNKDIVRIGTTPKVRYMIRDLCDMLGLEIPNASETGVITLNIDTQKLEKLLNSLRIVMALNKTKIQKEVKKHSDILEAFGIKVK